MRRLGITGKLALHSAVVLAALGAAVTLYSVSQSRGLLFQEMIQRVEAQGLNWIEANTAQIILSGDPHTLHRLVAELKTRDGIGYVTLLDARQRERASAGRDQEAEREILRGRERAEMERDAGRGRPEIFRADIADFRRRHRNEPRPGNAVWRGGGQSDVGQTANRGRPAGVRIKRSTLWYARISCWRQR